VAASANAYNFDPAEVIAVGYSNGANIAAAMLLLRPETFPGAILFRAMVPLTEPPLPDLGGKRVLICAGRLDPIARVENAERLATLLRKGGTDVTLELQEASHGLVAEDLAAARRWLS